MDQEILSIETNTRKEKIKNFIFKNKILLIIIFSIIIFLSIAYFIIIELNEKKKIKLGERYNSIIMDYDLSKKQEITRELNDIINLKDKTYSPLALYFLLDNKLIIEKKRINNLFNILIDDTNLETEIKNLVIYKKALYNSANSSENEIIDILKPVLNSDSIWNAHALHLLAEYFYSKNEKQKAKEFFLTILSLPSGNEEIKIKAQNRIKRDFSE